MSLQITDRTKRLMIAHEGLNQPGKWPGGSSGITLGFGYDLGHHGLDEFREDWGPHLSRETIGRLAAAIGVTGKAARALAPSFADIRIGRKAAGAVFIASSLPKYAALTEAALPGVELLPPDAQGALVSLIYNRGGGMEDKPTDKLERRREMRAIRDAVAAGDLREIARQLRLMKRLWRGKGLDGLLRRREDEAALVELAAAGGAGA